MHGAPLDPTVVVGAVSALCEFCSLDWSGSKLSFGSSVGPVVYDLIYENR